MRWAWWFLLFTSLVSGGGSGRDGPMSICPLSQKCSNIFSNNKNGPASKIAISNSQKLRSFWHGSFVKKISLTEHAYVVNNKNGLNKKRSWTITNEAFVTTSFRYSKLSLQHAALTTSCGYNKLSWQQAVVITSCRYNKLSLQQSVVTTSCCYNKLSLLKSVVTTSCCY